MLRSMVKRAPFKGVPLSEVEPRPDHKFREWQEQGFFNAVVDRNGVVVRLCAERVNVTEMAEEMNTRAALTIMTEGTGADADWRKADPWKEHP